MTGKIYICTYFDYNYLPRGLALYESVRKYHRNFDFFILAFDDATYEFLTKIGDERIKPVHFESYNSYFNTSADKFPDRKQYYFSSTPNLCLYLIDKFPEIDVLLYLDADVYIFNPLDLLYGEFADSAIGITPHRINPFLKMVVKHYGSFNVGVNLFRNNSTGIRCLKEWKSDCDSWYPGKPGYPLKFFSDQIFLDSWPEKFRDVKIIENPGVNLVYWNVANHKLSVTDGSFLVDGNPLLVFHFSSLTKIDDRSWNTNSVYGLASVKGILREIYVKYILHIESFGISNRRREQLKHNEKIIKRISHYLLKLFFNELVVIENNEIN
jgi:hypothetical protein